MTLDEATRALSLSVRDMVGGLEDVQRSARQATAQMNRPVFATDLPGVQAAPAQSGALVGARAQTSFAGSSDPRLDAVRQLIAQWLGLTPTGPRDPRASMFMAAPAQVSMFRAGQAQLDTFRASATDPRLHTFDISAITFHALFQREDFGGVDRRP